MHVHSVLLCRNSKRGEIRMRGDVLLPRSFVRVGAYGVLAECGDSAAMPAGELFLACVSVVDGD